MIDWPTMYENDWFSGSTNIFDIDTDSIDRFDLVTQY